jgi:DNA-binding response OmpR family regulator
MTIAELLPGEQRTLVGAWQLRGIEAMKTARKRVLIADCHEEVLISLERMLEDEGFDTRTVWTAKEALRLLASEAFDLVLVNEYLPDAECEDILKALQRKGGRTLCIVMQPSAPEITEFSVFESLGATDVVYKYGYRHIVEVVNECLGGGKKNAVA